LTTLVTATTPLVTATTPHGLLRGAPNRTTDTPATATAT